MIKFNIPSTRFANYFNILSSLNNKKLTKNEFFNKTQKILRKRLKSNFFSLTQSGANALEVAFKVLNLKPNDEVIMPSFTFSATANAVILNNAKVIFADINQEDLCINLKKTEKMITKKTKALCLVHYSGQSCDMDYAMFLKKKYNLHIIEDAAHALFSKYKNRYCGTIGDIGIFSFHQSKNFTSFQGGAISVNNKKFINRTKVILNKGNSIVNKKQNYYKWIDVGSEYQMSEFSASLLYNQIYNSKKIQEIRGKIFHKYLNFFDKHNFKFLENYSKLKKGYHHSYHIFFLIFKSKKIANNFKKFMKKNLIQVASHYYPLHLSPFGKKYKYDDCIVTKKIFNNIIRLPIHSDLKKIEVNKIIKKVLEFNYQHEK